MINLNQRGLSNLPIPLPPTLAEQEAIAEALSDADALIDSLEQLIAKKRLIKQGAMQELLTGKRRLPGFSREWEVKPFDDVLVRLNAKAHQILAADYQASGRYPVVDQGQEFVVGFSDRVDRRFRCPAGGVIVFGDHTCIVKLIDFDFLVGADGTQVLRARDGHSTRFYAHQLQCNPIESTGYNRHFKLLKERSFLSPSLPEQAAIATILSDMDAEIAALEGRLEKARQIKQGMMQELLTGRVRLVGKS
jgi:type I restriction enzyme S subunit